MKSFLQYTEDPKKLCCIFCQFLEKDNYYKVKYRKKSTYISNQYYKMAFTSHTEIKFTSNLTVICLMAVRRRAQ